MSSFICIEHRVTAKLLQFIIINHDLYKCLLGLLQCCFAVCIFKKKQCSYPCQSIFVAFICFFLNDSFVTNIIIIVWNQFVKPLQ